MIEFAAKILQTGRSSAAANRTQELLWRSKMQSLRKSGLAKDADVLKLMMGKSDVWKPEVGEQQDA